MPTRRDLLERALLEASIKTDPQISALKALRSELAGSYSRTRRVNHSTAEAIRQATSQARPEVTSAFDRALASASAQRGALGVGAADPQAAAYVRRVSEQKAGSLNDLTQRELRAEDGKVYANQTARDEYFGQKGKINNQLVDLLGQRGALATSALGTLEDKARADATARRGQNITARGQTLAHRRGTEANRIAREKAQREAAAAKQSKSKIKWASQEQHTIARTSIEQAKQKVKQFKAGGMGRAAIIATLTEGAPKGIDEDGEPLPAIPKFAPDFVRAATNLVFDGSLSRGDLKRLHNMRLQLRRLGYDVRPPQGPRPNRATRNAGTISGRVGRRPPVPGLTR